MTTTSTQDNRPIDLLIFGPTSFTARLILQYLNRILTANNSTSSSSSNKTIIRVGLAGRNLQAIQLLAQELCPNLSVTLLKANVYDEKSLFIAVSEAHCVLSCVGPYSELGEPLIKACVSMGCDYVDINGELDFTQSMIDKYDRLARQNNVVLVPCAGNDSVPADLVGWFTCTQVLPAELATSHAVLTVAAQLEGNGISNGTLKTMANLFTNMNSTTTNNNVSLTVPPTVKLLHDVPATHGGPLAVTEFKLFPDPVIVKMTHDDKDNIQYRANIFEVNHALVLPNRFVAYLVSGGLFTLPYLFKLPFVSRAVKALTNSGWGPSMVKTRPYRLFGILQQFPTHRGATGQPPIETIVTRLDCDRDPYLVTAITAVQTSLYLIDRKYETVLSRIGDGLPRGIGGFHSPIGAVGGQNMFERCFECFQLQRVVVGGDSKL
jgi:short subunit dehydrogenase-like uncharacterized protein